MTRQNAPVYKFQEIEFPIEIEIPQAFTLKKEFGINLLNMFEGNNLDDLTIQINLNDEKILDIWWWIVSKKLSNKESALNGLTRDSVTQFKECLWAAIVNFSDPAAKQMLIELKRRLPGLLKKQVSTAMDELEKETPNPPNENSLI